MDLIIFTITFSVMLLNTFQYISLIVGNGFFFPRCKGKMFSKFRVDFWLIEYSALLYQVYFWSDKLLFNK